MSYTYLQGEGVESSAECFSDIPPSALSKSNHIAEKICSNDNETEFCPVSQSGMIYAPLTVGRGVEQLTLFAEDSHAKTYRLPAGAKGWRVKGRGSGMKWRGWSARLDHNMSSWKIAQCSPGEDLTGCSWAWPRWGMMRNGVCWERTMLELPTSGKGSGFWLTPRVVEVDETPENFRRRMNSRRKNDRKNGYGSLSMQVKARMWPTPNKRDWKDSGASQGARKSPNLGTVVHWPTPRSTDGTHGGRVTPRKSRNGGNLIEAVSKEMFTTPCADDTGHRKKKYAQGGSALSNQIGGQLNPTWVEWLMGVPIGWSDLKPLAMDRFRQWLQQHGAFYVKE